MAHFAQLDENSVVVNVIVVDNKDVGDLPFPDSESVGISYLKNLYGSETVWKQTSYNNNFRVRYAGVGSTYSVEHDAFIPPKPFPSWLFSVETLNWVSPTPHPTNYDTSDGALYFWNEQTLSWDQIT
jgi:hypothetical protein